MRRKYWICSVSLFATTLLCALYVINLTNQDLSEELHILKVSGTSQILNVSGQSQLLMSGGDAKTNKTIRSMRRTTTTKLIQLWSKYFESHKWKLGKEPFAACEYKDCIAIGRHFPPSDADLLLFHAWDSFRGLPSVRKMDQIYAIESLEPPTNAGMKQFKYGINLTISFRKDSDVFKPYFKTERRENRLTGTYVPKIPFQNKTRSIVWPVSHCRAASGRDRYARELAKYIDVDIYGKCGKLKCGRGTQQQCMNNFEMNYKFYLSFENSVCQDYITEKSSVPLARELVPVVFGGGDYDQDLPKHSYINVADFKSPRQLSQYLLILSNNETEYNKYFQWKQTHQVRHYPVSTYCELCGVLHQGTFHGPADRFDINAWWNKCHNDFIKKHI